MEGVVVRGRHAGVVQGGAPGLMMLCDAAIEKWGGSTRGVVIPVL